MPNLPTLNEVDKRTMKVYGMSRCEFSLFFNKYEWLYDGDSNYKAYLVGLNKLLDKGLVEVVSLAEGSYMPGTRRFKRTPLGEPVLANMNTTYKAKYEEIKEEERRAKEAAKLATIKVIKDKLSHINWDSLDLSRFNLHFLDNMSRVLSRISLLDSMPTKPQEEP